MQEENKKQSARKLDKKQNARGKETESKKKTRSRQETECKQKTRKKTVQEENK